MYFSTSSLLFLSCILSSISFAENVARTNRRWIYCSLYTVAPSSKYLIDLVNHLQAKFVLTHTHLAKEREEMKFSRATWSLSITKDLGKSLIKSINRYAISFNRAHVAMTRKSEQQNGSAIHQSNTYFTSIITIKVMRNRRSIHHNYVTYRCF